ncbi:hypothetical protein [Azospirillum endophyticum]
MADFMLRWLWSNNAAGIVVHAARPDILDDPRAPEVVRSSPLAAHRDLKHLLTKVNHHPDGLTAGAVDPAR